MSFNIKSLGGAVTSAVSSLAKAAGPLGDALSKLKGESDVLQTLKQTLSALGGGAQAKTAEGTESPAEGGADYAKEALDKKLEENKLYLGTLLGSDANKVMDKIRSKVEDFMKANPGASNEQVDAEVRKTFNNESLSAKIFKDVIDKAFQETLSRIREANE